MSRTDNFLTNQLHLAFTVISGYQCYLRYCISPLYLSHFQRFFVNEAFCRNPDCPVFLYIGGEGPVFAYDILAGTVELFDCTTTN